MILNPISREGGQYDPQFFQTAVTFEPVEIETSNFLTFPNFLCSLCIQKRSCVLSSIWPPRPRDGGQVHLTLMSCKCIPIPFLEVSMALK